MDLDHSRMGRFVPINLELLACSPNVTFAVEIRMNDCGDDLQAANLEVRRRCFEAGQGTSLERNWLSNLTERLVGWLSPPSRP